MVSAELSMINSYNLRARTDVTYVEKNLILRVLEKKILDEEVNCHKLRIYTFKMTDFFV